MAQHCFPWWGGGRGLRTSPAPPHTLEVGLATFSHHPRPPHQLPSTAWGEESRHLWLLARIPVLVYLLLCVAWEFHYFLSRDFAVPDHYFKSMKHALYPQESCDWVNLWVLQSLCEEPPAPGPRAHVLRPPWCLSVSPAVLVRSSLSKCRLAFCISSAVNFCFLFFAFISFKFSFFLAIKEGALKQKHIKLR